jgi:hypothetical protein
MKTNKDEEFMLVLLMYVRLDEQNSDEKTVLVNTRKDDLQLKVLRV